MKRASIIRNLNQRDWPRIIEVTPATYLEVRNQLLEGGYDWLVGFEDFGSFRLDGFVLRNRERGKAG